ncbi:Calx-beta domain-containing protein [Roseomonas harenae]|uniref:Calx-beta domain-containing protein n=1 Tax=Muricoccus harenae TaxID=2692566 RepID=UPI001331A544|nr:hypothetical protein [Roseomonas harenae]
MSNLYVSGTAANGIPAGNDATGDGSRERPWATVERANAAAANGDTVYLNDGVYTPATGLVVSNSVTWLGVTDYGATIRGAAGQSRVIGISEDQGGTVTFGKIVIDGANTTTALITVSDQPSTYTLHLDGIRLVNPTSYGIQGASTGTRADLNLDNVQFSATSALAMVNIPNLKAGDVTITGGSVDIASVWRSGFGGIANIDASAAGSTVAISGVEANLHATGTDAAGTGGIYYGIRLTDVQAPLIENNKITQSGTSADQTGYTVSVTYDKLAPTPIDISGGVIRYNNLYNYLDGSAGKIILVGHDSDPGVAARNLANDFQIYGNSGFGDEGAEAAKLHGILVGWQDGAKLFDNALDYTSLAYVLKGMSGETLVFDNTDTRTTSKSLYQKGGDGVQFLYNTSYMEAAFNPDAINIGDSGGGLYAATGAVVVGNTVVYTGAPDSFLTIWDGSSAATIAGNNYYSVMGNSSSAWIYQGTSYKSFEAWQAAHETTATYNSDVKLGQGAILSAVGVSGQALKLVGMVNGVETYSVKFTTGTASSTTFAIGNFGADGAAAISGLIDADMSGPGSASLSGSGTQDGTYAGLDSGELLTFRISYNGLSAVGGQVLHITGNYTNTRPIDIIIEGGATGSSLSISDPLALFEGNSGSTTFTYTVTRSGDTSGASSASWSVMGSGSNPAGASDFVGGLPSGTVSFAAGETSKTITVTVAADAEIEQDETFTLTLSSPSAGTTITSSTSTGTIRNDDVAGGTTPTEGNDNLTGTEAADIIDALGGNDTVDGLGGNDTLIGGAGNDTLIALSGDDRLEGGLGDDSYYVDSTADIIVERSGEGIDTAYFSGAGKFTLKSNVDNLVLTGTTDSNGTGNSLSNTIIGNAGNNILSGGDGDDTIFGGSGDDLIEGGGGRDILSSGDGADRFIFRSAADVGGGKTGLPSDLITDWAPGDKIDLSRLDAIASTSTNDAFAFIGSGAFTAAGQLHYIQSGDQTFVEGDMNGDLIADFSLALSGLHTLTATDFVL